MSSTNDTVFPISFPVQDTTRTRSDIALVQTAIDSLQARNIPLFPDQSAALGKFTLTINKVKNTHDAVAKSMARSTKGITYNAFAMQSSLKAAANAAAKVAYGAASMGKVTTASRKAALAARSLAHETDKVTEAKRKLTAADKLAVKGLTKFSRVIAIVQGPLGPIAGRLTAAAVAIRSMGTAALAGGLALGVVGMAMRRAIPAAIDLQRTQSTLSAAMNGNAKDTAAAFKLTIAEARRTGVAFDGLAASYAQLAASARGTVLAGAEINKIFKAVNTASLALRLDLNQTKGVIKAMEQMISKGTVSAEEMRQQLGERLPGAFRLAANAMKMTTAEFSKNMALGKILAEDLLPKLAREMEKAYGTSATKAAATLGVALNKLDGEVNIFYGSLVQPEMLNAFTGIIDWATQSLRDLGTALKPVPGEVNKVTFALQTLAEVAGALFGLKMLSYVARLRELAVASRLIRRKFNTASSAAKTLGSSMVILEAAVVLVTVAYKTLWRLLKKNYILATIASLTTLINLYASYKNAQLDAKMAALTDGSTAGIDKQIASTKKLIAADQMRLALAREHLTVGVNGTDAPTAKLSRVVVDTSKTKIKEAQSQLRGLQRVRAAAVIAESKAEGSRIRNLKMSNGLVADLAKAQSLIHKDAVAAALFSQNSMNNHIAKLKKQRIELDKVLTPTSGASTTERSTAVDALSVNKKSMAAATTMSNAMQELLDTAAAKKLKSKRRSLTALLKEDTTYLDALKQRTGDYTRTASEQIKFDNDASVKQARAHRDTIIADVNATGEEKKKAEADLTTTLNLLTQERSQLLLRESKKVVDIHSLKFKKIMALGKTAFADETTRLLDKSKIALDALDAEHKRVSEAAASQYKNEGERKTALAALDDYYAQKKIDLAQQTADKIAVIDKTADDAAQARLKGAADAKLEQARASEQAGSDLKAMFGQTNLSSQQIDLTAMSSSLSDHFDLITSKTGENGARELDTKKMWGKSGLTFLKGSLEAASGLMNSHNKKAFMIGKAAAIAGAVVNTLSGVVASLAPPPVGAGPLMGPILATAIGVAGALNIAKIASTTFGGGATTASAGVNVNAGGGRALPVSFNPGRSVPQKLTTPQAPTPNTAAAFAVRAQAPAPISIVQNITAPNATVGSAQAIQQAANLGAQQALAAVSADFTNNGALRQTLAV